MPTARSLMAALALAFTAVSCSDDQAPTGPDTKNTAEAPSAAITQSPQQLVFSVTGQQTDGGTFTGTARITEITRVGNQLFATGDELVTGAGDLRDSGCAGERAPVCLQACDVKDELLR